MYSCSARLDKAETAFRFRIHVTSGFNGFFQPPIWQEVDDAESWITIPNRVMSAGTHMPNFMKIGSKLWPWQCTCIYNKYGGRDVIYYVNEPKHKRAQLDLLGTIPAKFEKNRPGSFGVLARTDTHTDRHTHTQTDRQTDNPGISDPNDYNTFSQWKWLNVKKHHMTHWTQQKS